jgi:class 3 adenylate cyclase
MKIKPLRVTLIETATIALYLAWFFLPATRGLDHSLRPFTMPMELLAARGLSVATAALFLVYLVPLFAVYLGVCIFLEDKIGKAANSGGTLISASRIVATSIMLFATVFPVLAYADSDAYFSAVEPISWVLLALTFAASVLSVRKFLSMLNYQNPVYREYKAFKREQKNAAPADRERSKFSGLEILFRIRSKLFFAFIGIISLILVSMSALLLNNYRATILKAVGDAARTQVEQSSATYRINLGDTVGMFEFFARQKELNEKAEFRYRALTIYSNLKKEIYTDDLPADMPDFRAEYSTEQSGVQYPELEPLAGQEAMDAARGFAKDRSVYSFHDEATRSYGYVSPIIKLDTIRKGDQKIKRERLLGFSVMLFDEDVVMRPYYRTQIMVLVCTAFFLYLAIVLTYIVGNYIVNPLLFLRMSVRKISDVLSTMIRGQTRVSAASLVYNDTVTSRDEIKLLSTEINDMVTVIRGIVPYISASTLKHAESGVVSSTQKELAFLFTDIRGFTTLCEGLAPNEVVSVLNRYLDLETEIILNNHGDVDKFVGDEMMAFFEGPDKEENACRAAMQIRRAMMKEKEEREKTGKPIVAIGIGINVGPVVFGSVGARDRMDFTSIGDTVNLAARLEGANKAYGSKTIITEAVMTRVEGRFLCRELDYIAVKGKNEPVRIFEILQAIPEVHPRLKKIKDQFEAGLAAYRIRDWDKALVEFKKNVDEFNDNPSAVFIDRVEHFQKNPPPAEWDGVFRMTVK